MRKQFAFVSECIAAAKVAVKYRSLKFCAFALLALWLGIAAKHVENRKAAEVEATRDLQNFVSLAKENVVRSIGEMDKAILYLRGVIEAAGERPDYDRIASNTDVTSAVIVQVALIDETGMMRASSVGPRPTQPIDLSDREHFRFHSNRTDDVLFMSKPVIGRASGRWSVQLARKFKKPDGSFGGIVVASFDPSHFSRNYGRVNVGTGATYSLIGADGVVRALSQADGIVRSLGQDLSGTPLMARLGNAPATAAWVKGNEGRSDRLFASEQVAEHGLHVVASLPASTVLSNSRDSLSFMVAVGVIFSLLIAAAGRRFMQEEKSRLEKERQLSLTLEHMTQGIMLVTSDLEVPVVNRQCFRLLGLPEELLLQKSKFDEIVRFQSENGEFHGDLPDGADPLSVYGPKNADGRFEFYERTRPDGTVIEVRTTMVDNGGFVRTFSDITQRRKAQVYADKLAAEDALTGLANRRMLVRALDQFSERVRNGALSEFAVLYVDLDRFKIVNDSLGHAIGDQLLEMVAQRLKKSLRSDDVVARLGGDEFAVVLPLPDDNAASDLVAQRLVDSLSRPYEINGSQVLIGASVGIAVAPHDGQTSSELLIASDLALYAAKSAGRCTFRYYSRELDEDLKARQEIESELRHAIADNKLELHYQPIISLKHDRLIGFEALARWNHPKFGMVPPDKFIPIAEDCGLIQILGRWALETACREAVSWGGDLTVAVNLSPLQFSDPGLLAMIERVLLTTGLEAQRLEVEVTEGLLMTNTASVLDTLSRLKGLGVHIAMDDFGTGYSSLAYLQRFDFDRIKVDRCFVNRLGNDASSKAIVRAVIDIASSRGMHTTAEGVETETQRMDLTELGCDEAQGYLFSRPVAAIKIPAILDQWRRKPLAA